MRVCTREKKRDTETLRSCRPKQVETRSLIFAKYFCLFVS